MAPWSDIRTGTDPCPSTGRKAGARSRAFLRETRAASLALLLFITSARLQAQDSVTVVPGAGYEAGWVHRLFFGDHWRDAWTTPVRVPVLDLDRFAGGLKPVERGGGFATKSLRFQGRDGRTYKFRSLDKDPAKILPEELRESVVADIVKDQTSSSNPFAQLTAVPLMNAVGILNAEPVLFVLPDDDRLGEFKAEFGGLVGTLEEHPDKGPDGEPGFGGAEKVLGSYKLLERMEKDHRHRVNGREFLKARLMDVYLGDWDRHPDQWRWAGFRTDDRWEWTPIPRDRDQAFARFDGVMPWIAELAVPQLTHFSDSYSQINDLTWSGRHLDRRFLPGVTRPEWDSVTASVQSALSDEVITAAVNRMPAALLAAEGEELGGALRKRRDDLPDASSDFYHLTVKYSDIHASDKPEFAQIVRRNDTRVDVEISARDPETGGPAGSPFFSRTFDPYETKEIRLLMHGGDDSVVVSGGVRCSPEIHVDGGEGRDCLVDRSSVQGWFLGIVPFLPVDRTKTYFYDSGKKTVFVEGSGTSVDRSEEPAPGTEEERWRPATRDFGHDWKFGPWFAYTPDDGLFIGGGPILYEFGFRARPYVYRMSLLAGYATGLQRFRLQYTGAFYSAVKGARLSLYARASGIDVINYFGSGNETTIDRDDDFYKIRQRQLTLESALDFFPGERTTLSLGIAFRHAATELDPATLLGQEKPHGVDDISLLGLTARAQCDTRDNEMFPCRGFYARGWSVLVLPTWNNDHTFGRIGGEARAYLTDGVPLGATVAVRMVGEYVVGTYPFFEASFLGGSPLLRGFDLQRFSGDGMAVGNIELRVPVADFFVLVPESIGFTAFGETGRVFVRGKPSSRWHPAAGGGFWLSFINRNATLSVSIARSAEATGVYIMGGFMF